MLTVNQQNHSDVTFGRKGRQTLEKMHQKTEARVLLMKYRDKLASGLTKQEIREIGRYGQTIEKIATGESNKSMLNQARAWMV